MSKNHMYIYLSVNNNIRARINEIYYFKLLVLID